MLIKIFGIFERLLAQNLTNQGSQLSWFFQNITKNIRKFRNMALHGIISAWKWFQNLFRCKFHNMAEKLNFMVFRASFLFDVHSQQRWYLILGNPFWSVIRGKKTEHFKRMKKSIMAAQKCKNYIVVGSIKVFWITF